MKMLTAVSVKEKQGAGLSYSNHNLWRHDAPSHLTFERNDGIRTGYAPEAESRTWSSRLYCDGDIPPLYPVYLSFTIINGLPKISEKRWSRQGFSFTLCSHFSSAIHIPFTFYSQNAPTSISIMGLGGVKEWKKKLLCRTFFRFSRTFPPLIFSPRQAVSRHLAGKAHCNAGTTTHQHARKTAPQCCKHRQLASPTKLKPICMKFQIFHFTLTSLDFTRLHS